MTDPPQMDAAREVLRRVFGHRDFRGLQAGVVGEVLAGRSALAVLPTGGGKSLCYQIPSLVRPGLGLVVSPLIALMADQVAAMQQQGVAAAQARLQRHPRTNAAPCVAAHRARERLDLLYMSPEGLMQPSATLDRLANRPLALDRHRRGALRQPVGPRFPTGIPHPRPPRRHLSRTRPASL